MKSQRFFRPLLNALVLVVIFIHSGQSGVAAPTEVFFTRFEATNGYSTSSNLVGQGPWTSFGSGGNGIVSEFFPGEGQQAYIGFLAATNGDDQLIVWPTNLFNPVAIGLPLVTFSVRMQIADSSNGEYDFFQWRAYNPQGQRLFILDFDNYFTNISYRLDGNGDFTDTGVYFAPDATYTLLITMNFASNRWSASLDNTLIVTNLPITTTNAALGFGDVAAVWALFDIDAPGDNFMLFDNYRITAEALTVAPVPSAQLQFLGRTSGGWALLRVFGQDNSRWSLDATTNFANWTYLKTNTVFDTYFDYIDTTAAPFSRRFYRARLVP